MAVRTYYRQDGEILSEDSDGSVLDFLTDALGSVTATVDQTATIQSKARYKPYGDLLSGSVLRMAWVGSLGYRPTGLAFSNYYMTHRHYGTKQGQWTTGDPFFPQHPIYNYVSAKVTGVQDRFGLGTGPVNIGANYNGINGSSCGYFRFTIGWYLYGELANTTGSVIQHISIIGQDHSCDPKAPPPDCNFFKNGAVVYHYLEAWRHFGGNLWPDSNGDVFGFDGCPDCSSGAIWWNAKFSYYIDYLPKGPKWHKATAPHPAKYLYINEPVDPGVITDMGGAPQQRHWANLTWDCCRKPVEYHAKGFADGWPKPVMFDIPGGNCNPKCGPCCK